MGGWGLNTSSAAESGGTTGIGGFNFQPKGGNTIPPVGWIAIAAVALVLLLKR